MVFSKEFFDVQFSFAEKVRALSGMPLENALLGYTNFYVRFGLGREFEPRHPTWQAYLAGLRAAEDAREWTYRFTSRLDAYRRLFPPMYGLSARVLRGRFRSMPLWGQFVNYRGQVKETMTRPFLRSLAQHSSLAGLDECFPFQVLTVGASAEQFYDFYGV